MKKRKQQKENPDRLSIARRTWGWLISVALAVLLVVTWQTIGQGGSASDEAPWIDPTAPSRNLAPDVSAHESPHFRLEELNWDPALHRRPTVTSSRMDASRPPQWTRPLAEPELRPTAKDPYEPPALQVDPRLRNVPTSARRSLE